MFRKCIFRFKTVLTYFQAFKVHLETIFDVVKVVKVLQVSVTSLFQEVLLCLRSGLGMHIFLDVGDNFTTTVIL